MRTRRFGMLAIVGLAWMSGVAYGAEDEAPAKEEARQENKRESWYWGFSLGYAPAVITGGALESSYDTASSAGAGVSSASVGSQLYFYWPVASLDGLLGVASGGGTTVYSGDSLPGDAQFFTVSVLTLSYLHSFGEAPGSGLMLRGGLGFGAVSGGSSTDIFGLSGDENGIGIRAALGYGIPVSSETRLLIDFTFGTVLGAGASYWALNFGPLF